MKEFGSREPAKKNPKKPTSFQVNVHGLDKKKKDVHTKEYRTHQSKARRGALWTEDIKMEL